MLLPCSAGKGRDRLHFSILGAESNEAELCFLQPVRRKIEEKSAAQYVKSGNSFVSHCERNYFVF